MSATLASCSAFSTTIARPRIREDETHLGREQRRIDRNVDRAQMQDREIHDVPVGAVSAQQAHTVALADPQRGEAASEAGDTARDLGGRQLSLAAAPGVHKGRGRLCRLPQREEIQQRVWFRHHRPPERRSRPHRKNRSGGAACSARGHGRVAGTHAVPSSSIPQKTARAATSRVRAAA
jgi:hypothetical protein